MLALLKTMFPRVFAPSTVTVAGAFGPVRMEPKVAVAPMEFGTPAVQFPAIFAEPPPSTFHTVVTASPMVSSMVVAPTLSAME